MSDSMAIKSGGRWTPSEIRVADPVTPLSEYSDDRDNMSEPLQQPVSRVQSLGESLKDVDLDAPDKPL